MGIVFASEMKDVVLMLLMTVKQEKECLICFLEGINYLLPPNSVHRCFHGTFFFAATIFFTVLPNR